MKTLDAALTLALPLQFSGAISALAWSPDSNRIAAASSCGSVAIWETNTGTCVFEYHMAQEHLTALTWTGQGRCLLLGSKQGTLSLLHLASGDSFTSASFSSPITRIAYAPSHKVERFFVVAGTLVRIFTAGQPHPQIRRYATPVIDAAWCPAGRSIAILTQHGQVEAWDMVARSARVQTVLQNAPRCLTWGATDQVLTIGTEHGKIQDYSLSGRCWGSERPVSRFPLAVLLRGKPGVIAQSARDTVLWCNQTLHALAHSTSAVALDPYGATLATAQAQTICVAPLM